MEQQWVCLNLHSSHTRTKWDLNIDHNSLFLSNKQSCNVILQCILFSYVFRRLLWQFWSNFRWLWWVHTPYLVWVGFVFNSLLFSKRAVFGGYSSLRSKRFHTVSEQRKTEERDSRVFGRAGNDLPSYSRHSLTFAPRFLLRNNTETLATQATGTQRVLRFTLSSRQILTWCLKSSFTLESDVTSWGHRYRGSQLYQFLKLSSVPSSN